MMDFSRLGIWRRLIYLMLVMKIDVQEAKEKFSSNLVMVKGN